jgi:hypothetical protein
MESVCWDFEDFEILISEKENASKVKWSPE